MTQTAISVLVTLTLVHGNVDCGTGNFKYWGCYFPNTKTIEVNADLPAEDFKYTVIHEVAHAKFNGRPEAKKLFKNISKPLPQTPDKWQEKLADWFTIFWEWPDALWFTKIGEFFRKGFI